MLIRFVCPFLAAFLTVATAAAASRTHTVTLGKAVPVKVFVGPSEDKTVNITVRPLYVDGKVKDFTTGETHDITDHEFVVRRAYRINDSLPLDTGKTPKWLWEPGDWMLVDRHSGKATLLKLPDFDPFYSQVSWYRDYAAYCGIPSSGERVNAVVFEIGNKKPLFRKELGKNTMGNAPDSNCSAPQWERRPARATFLPKMTDKFTVNVSGRFADQATDNDSDEP
ncbi:MAG TPA: hypothetical protein VGG15_10590 [Terriglobales bacterium]|jgi:hypothetical protein